MYIYTHKSSNIIFYYTQTLAICESERICGPDRVILIPIEDYSVIEVPNQELLFFTDGKYIWKDDEIQYFSPQDEINDKWELIREKRDTLLPESDSLSGIMWPDYWTQKSEQYQTDWLTYRQKLRDITVDFANPDDVVWPTMPTEHADSPT